ncbi:hypothetical protein JTB14_024953 [Gonioctena quinquepunctata]|nr:hypothetical protein JTB14_024953 [Gonioctena quinquepunctata]
MMARYEAACILYVSFLWKTVNDIFVISYNEGTSVGTGEPRIFKQENYSTESEEDIPKKTETATPFTTQKSKSVITPPNFPKMDKSFDGKHKSMYNSLQEYSNLDEVITENTRLLPPAYKRTLDSKLNEHHSSLRHTNNSMVTIFAIWNTTMGSSLLAMAWGIEKSGLFAGILINLIVAALCLYTTYVLLVINSKHGIIGQNFEVSDLCRLLIGKWAEILSKTFSLIVLIGGDLVYWILMSNFMYNVVHFWHGYISGTNEEQNEVNVKCLKDTILNFNTTNFALQGPLNPSNFDSVWDLYSTVPVFLAVLMFPLLNFKSPTFFTKFNSFGTLSVAYLLIFVAIKSFGWGVNIQNWALEFDLKPTFCVLSGMLSMSYFIHNIIISVMRQNKHQEHNGRDLTIAFSLITFTYVFIGVAFHISFPLSKSCIEDNLLNNFSKGDALAIIARVLLFFQLFTVFPLITFMLRSDIFNCLNMIFKNKDYGEFSYGKAITINGVIVFICIMFACFMPRIGTLIRYTGALSGMVYIFLMPSLLKIASLKKEDSLTMTKLLLHIGLIILGVLNLFSQFFISD